MSNNYLKAPSLFQTGFLPNRAESRIRQGLMPQGIANNCQDVSIGSAYMSPMEKDGAVCTNKYLYSSPAPIVNYGPAGAIPDGKGCECTQYLYQYN